jgi:hypothetical protein
MGLLDAIAICHWHPLLHAYLATKGGAIVSQDNSLKILQPMQAATFQTCSHCGHSILKGEKCYGEYRSSSRTTILKRICCVRCFHKQSTALLSLRFNCPQVPKPSQDSHL